MRVVTLRLNRQSNRIVVKHVKNNIRVGVVRRNIKLRHSGLRGPEGPAGTIAVGDTTTLPAGSNALVENVGTSTDAIFDFFIPKGDKGDTGVSTFVRVHHRDDPNVARPDALYVEWVGSVAPLNATEEDTWIGTV